MGILKKIYQVMSCNSSSLQTDIQEFYEVTLLNSQKSYEQKIEEVNEVAEKWEKTTSPATGHENLQEKQEVL
uniref:Uncharacterized protein n=1 Tax=Nothoprocta perdicaria TaxID=30464 RepID=A0A8C6YY37_NOTPE